MNSLLFDESRIVFRSDFNYLQLFYFEDTLGFVERMMILFLFKYFIIMYLIN